MLTRIYNSFCTLSRHDVLPLFILKKFHKPPKLEVKLPHGDLIFFFSRHEVMKLLIQSFILNSPL